MLRRSFLIFCIVVFFSSISISSQASYECSYNSNSSFISLSELVESTDEILIVTLQMLEAKSEQEFKLGKKTYSSNEGKYLAEFSVLEVLKGEVGDKKLSITVKLDPKMSHKIEHSYFARHTNMVENNSTLYGMTHREGFSGNRAYPLVGDVGQHFLFFCNGPLTTVTFEPLSHLPSDPLYLFIKDLTLNQ